MGNQNGEETRDRILKFIREFFAEHQIPPSYREIMEATDITSTSIISYHLHMLVKQGKGHFAIAGAARSFIPADDKKTKKRK